MSNVIQMEECELLGDSKYRAYISQVEKVLRSFENTSEWADLISALGKLNKVLTSHVKFPVIPKRVTIGKRLAQCLHPALPSGVHLKALETYDIIFKCIGTQRLSHDLFTYCAGLFPLLGYAAMNVKPMLLSLYETHFVPLNRHIRPALTGLLLGLLPGLEEGSEYYDRTNQLLEEFCEATEPTFFYGCLWECVLSCSSARLPAFTFVLEHFNKKQNMDDQLHFMGSSIEVLVEALCTSVQDSSVLVQRSALDFIQTGFPLHYSPLTKPDISRVVTASVKVVLRRDMSLNRRLYAWLLGLDSSGNPIYVPSLDSGIPQTPTTPGGSLHQRQDSISTIASEPDLCYFNTYSKELLITAFKTCIRDTLDGEDMIDGKPASFRPYRILISLLDKPEIGGSILDDVLIDIIRFTYIECEALSCNDMPNVPVLNGPIRNGQKRSRPEEKQLSNEIIKTANLLFGSFEPNFLWEFLGLTFERVCSEMRPGSTNGNKFVALNQPLSVSELSLLMDFLLHKVSLETYTETQTQYLPELLSRVTQSLSNHCTKMSDTELTRALKLCSQILKNVQPCMSPIVASSDIDSSQGSPVRTPWSQRHGIGIQDTQGETGVLSESETYLSAESDYENLNASEKSSGRSSMKSSVENSPLKLVISDTSGMKPADSFSDFVKFGDMKNQAFSPVRHSKKRDEILMQSCIQDCVASFQRLFVTVVKSRIVNDPEFSNVLLSQLHISPGMTPTRSFRRHMASILPTPEADEDGVKALLSLFDKDSTIGSGQDEVKTLPLPHLSTELCEAFMCACQLLVEFSYVPMYCSDQKKVLHKTFKHSKKHTLPDWLQLLITCSCFVINFDIQMAAMQTMLELISLTKSVAGDKLEQEDNEEEEDDERKLQRQISEGTVAVVIVPSMSPQNLWYLNTQTAFYKIVAMHLWNYLGESTPMYHQRSMELLSQLHQLAPTPWVCEDVIGNALLSDEKRVRLDAHKKFSVLWHLLREHRLNAQPGQPIRTFDRSMFLMLDSLASDTNPCRALTATWLTHGIQRADISRILEPILLILLHPDTARISIQHVNFHQPKKLKISEAADDSDSSETKIYAISSEGGNVIYHVSNDGGKPISKKTTEELRTFALTTITESGSATKASRAKGDTEFSFDRVDPRDVNLRLNPFGSENSLDKVGNEPHDISHSVSMPNIANVKRLNVDTCKKEGIYFDDVDGEEENESSTDDHVPQPELTPEEIVRSILEEILDRVTDKDPPPVVFQSTLETSESSENLSFFRKLLRKSPSRDSSLGNDDYLNVYDERSELDTTDCDSVAGVRELPDIHPLHTHLILYTQKYDAQRTLYALTALKSIVNTTPRLVACAMATTSISSSDTPNLNKLHNLLVRHRRSVFGKNFFSDVPADSASLYRTSMFIEVIISVTLYYIRSYYPNLMMSKLSDTELNGNKEVQILSCELLTLLLSELVNLARDSGRGFSTYISDLLNRCKVQKAVVHCLLASVYNARLKPAAGEAGGESVRTGGHVTEAIISFNEENMDANTNETFQIKLLKLIIVLILLEDQIRKHAPQAHLLLQASLTRHDLSPYLQLNAAKQEGDSTLTPEWEKNRTNFQPSLYNVKYNGTRPIVYQSMLLSAILSALRQQQHCHMHRHWITMVTSTLPYMGRALSCTVTAVVNQICRNIELLAKPYEEGTDYEPVSRAPQNMPPDHLLMLLEGLTTICHYCLLDNAQQDISIGQSVVANHNNVVNDTATASQILTNLFNVFNPYGTNKEPSPDKEATNTIPPVIEARRNLLSILPRILASLTTLWRAINVSENKKSITNKDQPWWMLGMPKGLRQQILEFASPISRHHGINMLGAVAVVWTDRKQRNNTAKKVIPPACEDQLLLVEVVSAMKVLPTDTLMQTIRQVIKQPPPTNLDKQKKRTPLEVSMLQFFFAYMQQTSSSQLTDSWSSLHALLKDGLALNLTPPGQFLLLAILNEFVQKVPVLEEKKDQRDLQDLAQKLLEACSEIAGSSLEQTTWLRRNLAVKPGRQLDVLETNDITDEASQEEKQAASVVQAKFDTSYRQYSVPALVMLADLIAPLLDVIYSSEEKDKVVPFLNNVMHNVFPYLRNHSAHNLPSFRACSQILASLSSYQYTRKAWRKEAFELLLDPTFFQMDDVCVGYWRTIIDNLMTHDKTTFKDLLARVVVASSSSINLFSSREAEYEQRAMLLKRLTFTIFCSECDQYHRHMPDIQERLADSIRLPSVPSIQAQTFLCFRVLVLRMSPNHLTSLWPTVITELVHVLLQLEQVLTPDLEDKNANKKRNRQQLARMANLDSSWALGNGNGLNTHNNPSWLQLYLATCKLLDLAMCLPTDILPQFQLYRWAFTGDPGADPEVPEPKNGAMKQAKRRFKDQSPGFLPHVLRISRLMNQKYGTIAPLVRLPGRPLLPVKHISSLQDLHPFFTTVAATAQAPESYVSEPAGSSMPRSKTMPEMRGLSGDSNISSNGTPKSTRQWIEKMIETDFLEPGPRE